MSGAAQLRKCGICLEPTKKYCRGYRVPEDLKSELGQVAVHKGWNYIHKECKPKLFKLLRLNGFDPNPQISIIAGIRNPETQAPI